MSQNSFLARDVDLEKLAEGTRNFSGAEIEGLVKVGRGLGGVTWVSAASGRSPGTGPQHGRGWHGPPKDGRVGPGWRLEGEEGGRALNTCG
jgi:hypothetical protein